jgi:hypothetical protein
MPEYERRYLVMAALLAPAAGLTVVAGLVFLLFGPAFRVLTGLFYVFLVGAPIAYALEFLGIWYFGERQKGGQLGLPQTLLVSSVLGFLTPIVPVYGFNIVTPTISWTLIGGLGALGGVVSALTYRLLAPTGRPKE